MPTKFNFSSLNRRQMMAWFRSLDRQTYVRAGIVLGALVVGFLIGGLYGDLLLNRGIPVTISNVPEINRLIQKVSQHIVVNAGENPTVATVKDPNLLRQQNPLFFKDVEEGDRLIVWSDRAVLYSTKRDVVLSALVAPNLQAPWSGQQQGGQAAPDKSVTFEIRNGTGKAGAAQVLANRLKENGYTVAAVKDAAKTYPETHVVASSDKGKAADMGVIIPLTGGAAGGLPAGEKASSADILIILGTDQG